MPCGDGLCKEQAAQSHQQTENETAYSGKCEDGDSAVVIFFAKFHAHQHTGSRRQQHADGEHKLYDGFAQVDGTDPVLADEVTHDDRVHHITQAGGQCDQDT